MSPPDRAPSSDVRMHRFFVAGTKDSDEVIRLPESEAHHAARVLRVRSGEAVVILDGSGGEHRGVVTSVGRDDVEIRLDEHQRHPPGPVDLILVQAIAKGPAMEGLLHRAVELGCSRVVPLIAERSVSRPDDAAAKRARWEAVALEAAKQSGNPWRMVVELPTTPATWLARPARHDLLLVASLEDAPQRPHVPLLRHRQLHGRLPATVAIIIGPEGDFSPAEYAAFRAAGAQPISLGPHVLRVETAVTAVLAMLGSELGRLYDEETSAPSNR